MQLPAHFLSLLATVIAALSSADARPLKAQRSASGMITFPVRRVDRNAHIHVELRHQQHLNRAERLLARASGLPGPSDLQLRANLERRASYLSPVAKRFNIPSPGFTLPADGSDGTVSNVVAENDVTSDGSAQLAKDSSEIDPDGVDTSFVATFQLGTPARDFVIILDSGSGDFWVESDSCVSQTGSGCGNHTFLGQDSSSSFVNTKKQWSVTYGSGAAAGELVTDTLTLAPGLTLENHTFGIAHNISQSFSGDTVADGLMGLGKAGLSNQKTPTPVQALANAGLISAAITSYRLPRVLDHTNNGEITFGGLDESKFEANSLVTLNATDDAFWKINVGGVTVNGADISISGDRVALMDTGTTLLVIPTADAAAIHAKIPGAKLTSSGQYTVPCNTNASVAIQFGGKSFPINSKDLPFASGGRTTGDCTSGIAPTTSNPTQWLVGDTFLKSVYFSTNVNENTIKLARAI